MFTKIACVWVCLAYFGSCVVAITDDPLTIDTTLGAIQGQYAPGRLAREWLGVPFAKPPVNELRWKDPQSPEPWTTVKKTTEFSAGCPQDCNLPANSCPPKQSEDCLYLNVYAHASANVTGAAVMVFLHGGRYEQGAAGVALYEGYNMVTQGDVVVVTTNYRLGALGFLVVDDITGNFGVLDQRLALEWVQSNIHAFGGDPERVTIFGQSAGGASVAFHMVSPPSFPLFSQAIMESDPLSLLMLNREDMGKHGELFARDAGCTEKGKMGACVQDLNVTTILAAQSSSQKHIYITDPTLLFFPWTPNVDGTHLTDQPLNLFWAGKYAQVPLVIGHVDEEALLFIHEGFPKAVSKIEGEVILAAIFKGSYGKIAKEYPVPSDEHADCRPYLANLASDWIMDCTSRNVSSTISQDGNDVYLYNFNHAYEEKGVWLPNYPFCEGHVCHGEELPFVFGSAVACGYNFSDDEKALTNAVLAYWTNFAKFGDPNGKSGENNSSLPVWPKRTEGKEMLMELKTPLPEAVSSYKSQQCDFWDGIGYFFSSA